MPYLPTSGNNWTTPVKITNTSSANLAVGQVAVDPSVMKVGNTYHLYYGAYNSSVKLGIAYATANEVSASAGLSVVQKVEPPTSGIGTGSGYVNDGASATQTFASPTTTGNLIVVLYTGFSVSSYVDGLNITDNKGNAYTVVAERRNSSYRTGIAYAKNITGGSSHQVNCVALSGDWGVFGIYEVSGANTTSPLDIAANTNAGYTTTATLSSGTLSQADEIVFGVVQEWTTANPWNIPSGWTGFVRDDAANDGKGVGAYQIVSSTASVSFSPYSTGGSSGETSMGLATFKASGAGGGSSGGSPTKFTNWVNTTPDSYADFVLESNGTGWDLTTTETACILREDDGTLKMFYTGVNNSVYGIGLANGSNTSVFTKYPSAILTGTQSWEGPVDLGGGSFIGGVLEPSVIKDGSTYKMWYAALGFANSTIQYNIGYATSTNAITWSKQATPCFSPGTSGDWDDLYVSHINVLKDPWDGGYHLFYYGVKATDYDAGNSIQKGYIGHATSTDGTSFTRSKTTPMITATHAAGGPTAIFDGNKIKLWYFACANNYVGDIYYTEIKYPKRTALNLSDVVLGGIVRIK